MTAEIKTLALRREHLLAMVDEMQYRHQLIAEVEQYKHLENYPQVVLAARNRWRGSVSMMAIALTAHDTLDELNPVIEYLTELMASGGSNIDIAAELIEKYGK